MADMGFVFRTIQSGSDEDQ